MELWWCLDCRTRVELNRHGRCQCCDSDAVDTMERTAMYTTASAVLTPVAECAETLTVHLETLFHWDSESENASMDEPVLSY